jgi:ferrous iron transport protein A
MKNIVSLCDVRMGARVRVNQIHGGWRARQKLNQMGVHPGDILVVKRSGIMGGPLLIQTHGSDVAVGRGLARKIWVEAES